MREPFRNGTRVPWVCPSSARRCAMASYAAKTRVEEEADRVLAALRTLRTAPAPDTSNGLKAYASGLSRAIDASGPRERCVSAAVAMSTAAVRPFTCAPAALPTLLLDAALCTWLHDLLPAAAAMRCLAVRVSQQAASMVPTTLSAAATRSTWACRQRRRWRRRSAALGSPPCLPASRQRTSSSMQRWRLGTWLTAVTRSWRRQGGR